MKIFNEHVAARRRNLKAMTKDSQDSSVSDSSEEDDVSTPTDRDRIRSNAARKLEDAKTNTSVHDDEMKTWKKRQEWLEEQGARGFETTSPWQPQRPRTPR